MLQNKHAKGFTLIELLIVIAIVAILAAVVILTLNPAQLLAQSRDSNRISDMATLRSAVSLYLADVAPPLLTHTRPNTQCYMSLGVATSGAPTTCGGLFSTALTATTTATSTYRAVDGTGWLPVNFNAISAGSPLGNLPVDPVNSVTNYYAYAASTTVLTFEINANMESLKYASGSTSGDVESSDGGNVTGWYEVGTAPGLNL